MQTPQFLHPLDPLPTPSTSSGPSPSGGSQPLSGTLGGFSMERQEQDKWCWAAVSVSVAHFYGTSGWSQCTLAADELHLDCCSADGPVRGNSGCNRAWYLDSPLSRVGHLARISWSFEGFPNVQNEINASQPFCARIAWNGGGAHFVAVGGWSIDPIGTEFVDIYDPYYGFIQTPHASFLSAYRSSGDSWTHSYFTVAVGSPAGGGPAPTSNSPKSE